MQSPYFTTWKIINAFFALISYPIVRSIFKVNHILWRKGWRFIGIPIIQKHRFSEMNFGANFQIRSSARSNPIGANHPTILCTWQDGARLIIGESFGITGGSIIAAESIIIGNNVNIGANTTIIDTDFHPLGSSIRKLNPQKAISSPIVIEDDVFVGMNCLILKGVRIGKGSVIGAGSVVTRSIPSGVIAAGNPAKIIRKIDIE